MTFLATFLATCGSENTCRIIDMYSTGQRSRRLAKPILQLARLAVPRLLLSSARLPYSRDVYLRWLRRARDTRPPARPGEKGLSPKETSFGCRLTYCSLPPAHTFRAVMLRPQPQTNLKLEARHATAKDIATMAMQSIATLDRRITTALSVSAS